MLAAGALIATLLSSAPWSADVAAAAAPNRPSGAYVGVAGQTLLGPQDGWGSGATFDELYWTSVQAGWTFGDRFFHGPQLEAGYHQWRSWDNEFGAPPGYLTQNAHFGAGYRFGVDLWRGEKAALFLSGRLVAGWIPEKDAYGGALGQAYLQTEAAVGLRVALGPVRAWLGLGPAVGAYQLYVFTSFQAGIAIAL